MQRQVGWVLAAAAMMAAAMPLAAQVTSGRFTGTITPAPGQSLRLALHLAQAAEGPGLVGTMDSLDQGVTGLAIGPVSVEGDRLRFEVPAVSGSYEGRWDGNARAWVGEWRQGPLRVTLSWTPAAAVTPPLLQAAPGWVMPDPSSALPATLDSPAGAVLAAATVERGQVRIALRHGPGVKADAGTRFEIGSITKVFTALLLADMAVRGEVRLDEPVRDLLPPGTLGDHGNRPITLRDLAAHSSGLPRLPANLVPTNPQDPYAGHDLERLLAGVRSWTPVRRPGAMFEYSNFGSALLAQALARRAGKPYEDLLTERILRPLGLRDTNFGNDRLATPHGIQGQPVLPWDLASLRGAGGLRATVGDLARFAGALLDPPAPLRAAVTLMMQEPLRPAMGRASIGLGLFSVPTSANPLLTHDGGTGGMSSTLVIDPASGRGAVVLSNEAGRNVGAIGLQLIAGIRPPGSPSR